MPSITDMPITLFDAQAKRANDSKPWMRFKQALADATIEQDEAAGIGGLSTEDVLSLFAAPDLTPA